MKHGRQMSRAAFLIAALAIAGQAHARGVERDANGTGGSAGSSTIDRSGAVPEWYSVIGNSPTQRERAPARIVEQGVPAWYSVIGNPRMPRERESTALVERSQAVPRWYALG